jgi:amidase
MSFDDVHFMPFTALADFIRRREISPVELTETMLGRIETFDPGLKSYTTVTTDLAMEQAHAAEAEISKGKYRGPMHGVPVAVKDLCFTKGIRTTAGMTLHQDFIPDYDATVVTRLREAGSVLLGKVHMTEGATLEHHPDLPQPINPWKSDLWTGVSSSGSGIAPAAGMAYATIGSDTGGSIRFPSACNNLTGVKPTWGLISRYGIFDLAATFDHLGPMARSAADCAAMLQALAGWDPLDPTSLSGPIPNYLAALNGVEGARGVKIGIDRDFIGLDADPVVVSLVENAVSVLKDIGADIVASVFPSIDELIKRHRFMSNSELAAAHEETYPSQAESYGPYIRKGLDTGRTVSPTELAKGHWERRKFTGSIRRMFDDIEITVLPVFKMMTPTLAEMRASLAADMNALFRFTSPLNSAGVPTVTLPCGFSEDGRPVAFQLIGPHGSESLLLRVAHAYQQATDWHTLRPAGF